MVNAKQRLVGGMVAGILAGGCQSTLVEMKQMPGLPGTSWVAEQIDGQGVLDKPPSTLTFESAERVVGHGACNRIFGPVAIEGTAISFGPLATTRMACPPPIADQEDRFLKALSSAKQYEMSVQSLVLSDGESRPLIRFSPLKQE